MVAEAFQAGGESPTISAQTHNQAVVLQQALHTIPSPNSECMMRSVASKIGHQLGAEVTNITKTIVTILKVVFVIIVDSMHFVS